MAELCSWEKKKLDTGKKVLFWLILARAIFLRNWFFPQAEATRKRGVRHERADTHTNRIAYADDLVSKKNNQIIARENRERESERKIEKKMTSTTVQGTSRLMRGYGYTILHDTRTTLDPHAILPRPTFLQYRRRRLHPSVQILHCRVRNPEARPVTLFPILHLFLLVLVIEEGKEKDILDMIPRHLN